MSAQSTKLAVWGVGNHARRTVLPAIDACPALSLAGLSTRNQDVLSSEAEKWSCPSWSDPTVMLEEADIDAVYLATPIGLHHGQGSAVLAAGKDLWCEKALTATLADAEDLVDQSRCQGRSLCSVFAPTYHTQFLRIKDLIKEGKIGRIRSITARFGFPHLNADNIRYVASLGGGVLLDAGFYPLNICRRILDQEPEILGAAMATESGYEVDTSGAVLLGFADGVTAALEWGFGRHYRNEMEIWGENGSLFIERAFSKPPALETRLTIKTQDAVEEVVVPPCDQFAVMLEDFAGARGETSRMEAHRTEALAQQRIMEQVIRAAR